MSEMVERVAAAIRRAESAFVAGETEGQAMARLARSVITALSEPTEAMLDAGMNAPKFAGGETHADAKETWLAMIGEAMK